MKKEVVNKILKETEIGYDLISEKFSQTRNRFWGGLEFIKKYVQKDKKILDFGCGNGRLLEILKNKNINYVGVDVSMKLIDLAQNKLQSKKWFRDVRFLKLEHDFRKLGFPDNYFDTVYSIAVFHHLPSSKLRIETAEELCRIVKKGEYIIITVWDLWKRRCDKRVKWDWLNKVLRKSELDWNDCWITFTDNKGNVFKRFHHAFTKKDLKKTFLKAGFTIKKVAKIDGNIVLIGKK